MKTVAYLAGLLLSAPLLAFALGILALGHVIETRNVFTILYHAALAFAWGLPFAVLGCVALLTCGFFPRPRLAASGFMVALNVAAAIVVLGAVGLPRTFGEGVYLAPTVAAFWLHGSIVRSGVLSRRRPAQDPDGAS